MPFTKGNSGNIKGKPKGAMGKKTIQWEQFSAYCLNGGLEKLESELNRLQGKDYVSAMLTLLEFHKPKLTRSTIIGDRENPVIVNFSPVGNNRTGK